MINEREMLEYAAKACEINRNDYVENGARNGSIVTGFYSNLLEEVWNPLTNSADTAEMCAKLGINTFFYLTFPRVECSTEDAGDEIEADFLWECVSHNGTTEGKESAWRLAASMVAAKIGGYSE